jgi:hypothetical protein
VSGSPPSSSTVRIKFDRAYDRTWLLHNELSDIVPIPISWDIDHLVNGRPAPAGSGGCAALAYTSKVASDCARVWRFLTDDGGSESRTTLEGYVPSTDGDLTPELWQLR